MVNSYFPRIFREGEAITMNEYDREVITYNSEKKMDALALKSHQLKLSQQLKGSLGKDMNDILSGKKKVEFTFWVKLKHSFNNFLKMFN